jgi:hypothetical protein
LEAQGRQPLWALRRLMALHDLHQGQRQVYALAAALGLGRLEPQALLRLLERQAHRQNAAIQVDIRHRSPRRLFPVSLKMQFELVRWGELPAIRFGSAIRLPREACNKILPGEAA